MDLSIDQAAGRLDELARRAASGEEIVLTVDGRALVRLEPSTPILDPEARMRFMERIGREGARRAIPGPCAARSADFLYDDDGLPA